MLITPLTRGSSTKLRPVISATALTTASMSALTKLRVTGSSAARALPASAMVSAAMANKREKDRLMGAPRVASACVVGHGAAGVGNDSMRPPPAFEGRESAMRLNPLGPSAASKVRVPSEEKPMSHAATVPDAAARVRSAALGAVLMAALALAVVPQPARAADPAPKNDSVVRITAFPPAVLIDTAATKEGDADAETARKPAGIRFDSDEDFEAISERMPWVIGLIFLVVGSIFLTPIVLLVGIIWYKLRKARLQNEAMLALAERGVVPPAQAADALAAGTSP